MRGTHAWAPAFKWHRRRLAVARLRGEVLSTANRSGTGGILAGCEGIGR
jgi:hypothetical protein